MQSGVGRRVRPRVFAAAWLLAIVAAGCTPDGKRGSSLTSRTTVAFDSIDGPPAGVFQKLVQNLNDEAQARRVAVVSREAPSQYRIRGYLAAHVAKGSASIAWVWDVYDAQENRALRMTGEEPTGRAGRDAWLSADDDVLQRIARNGMDQLVAFLDSPESNGASVASASSAGALAYAKPLP